MGLWTRWLIAFPTTLTERADLHTIFRFTQTKEYNDKSEIGNRVLTAFVGIGNYIFSTYDAKGPNPAVDAKVPYNKLDGHWAYVYASYNKGKFYGCVLFKDENKAEHVELDVTHHVLTGFAKLVLSAKEFGYQPFHGWLYDPRVFLGEGAQIKDSKKVAEMVSKLHRKLPDLNLDAEDFKWNVPLLDTTNEDDVTKVKDKLDFKFEDKSQLKEYAYAFWLQNAVLLPDMEDTFRGAARLTTNGPETLGDEKFIGDRTLLTLTKSDEVLLSTYKIKDPGFETVSHPFKIIPYQWTYVYFAYKDGKAFGYVLTPKGPLTHDFVVEHIVPNKFYFHLVKETSRGSFFGKLQGVKLLFGSGSLVANPQELIDKWPYDPKNLPPPPAPAKEKILSINSAKVAKTKDEEYQ